MNPSPSPLLPRLGALAWIAGPFLFIAAGLVAELAWTTPYSWAANNISDLGNVHCGEWDTSRPRYVCSPLRAYANAGFITLGALLLAGIALTTRHWGRGAASWTARVLLGLSAAGWIAAGLAPADVDENLHVLGAALIMMLGNIGLLAACFLRRDGLLGRLRPFTVAVAALAVAATVLFFGRIDPGIGLGGAERVAAYGQLAWTLVAGAAILARRPPTASP